MFFWEIDGSNKVFPNKSIKGTVGAIRGGSLIWRFFQER
jgi:hypothetical protein